MLMYQNFGAQIASISETGLVKIQFFTPIIVPDVNLSFFNDSYLDVTAITGFYNDPNNDLFTWSATYLDQYYLELQVNFDTPMMVSLDVSYVFCDNCTGIGQLASSVHC